MQNAEFSIPAGLPDYADVCSAARRLKGVAHRTPVMTSTTLDRATGASVFLKCENFQRMGAFKFRGAYNALSRLSPEQKERGVVAFSSGNHAQAIALSARLLEMPATIVMPLDAPPNKLAATKGYGATVVTYDRFNQDREAIGMKLAKEQGMTLIPPYDHPDVIAGQGTAAKELCEDVGHLDALFVCLGGGGLLAGSALAARALNSDIKIYGVEPENGNDGQLSFRSGKLVRIDTPVTIADGAQTQQLGHLTFPIIQREVSDIHTVSDTELVNAMRFCAERMKMMIEPTGGLAFAGMRKWAPELEGLRVGVIISGGNVDLTRFANMMTTPLSVVR